MSININYDAGTQVSETLLDRLWCNYAEQHSTDPYYNKKYKNVSRRELMARQFEEWLFKEGGTIRRKNKSCSIEFANSEQAMLFKLKYG